MKILKKETVKENLSLIFVFLMFLILLIDRNTPFYMNEFIVHGGIALCLLASCALFLLDWHKDKLKKIFITPIFSLTVIIIFLRFVPVLLNDFNIENYLRFLFPVYLGIIVFSLFQKKNISQKDILFFLGLTSSLFIVLTFIHVLLGLQFELGYTMMESRLYHEYFNPNAIGLVSFLCIFTGTLMFLARKIHFSFYLIVSCMSFFLLYLTDSRLSTALSMGSLVFFLFVAFFMRKEITHFSRKVLLLMFAIFMLGYYLKPEIKRVYFEAFQTQQKTQKKSTLRLKRHDGFTLNGRERLWPSCFKALIDHPLGMVRGQYIKECKKNGSAPGVEAGAHNLLLQEALMSGWTGLVLSIFLLFYVLKNIFVAFVKGIREKEIYMASGAALCGMLVAYSLVDVGLFYDLYIQTMIFWALMGILVRELPKTNYSFPWNKN